MEKNIGVYEIRISKGQIEENKLRKFRKLEDCADCLCRVCARNIYNDSYNINMNAFSARCCSCGSCNENQDVIETDKDCISFLPDQNI